MATIAKDDQDKKGRVLVVDDDKNFLKLFAMRLQRLGYLPYPAISATEALIILEKHEIDILLTDLEMPEMDGIELIQEATKKRKNIVSLVISGHSALHVAIRAMRQGAINFLEKPVDTSVLDAALGQAMQRSFLLNEVEEKQKSLERANRELAKEINKSKMILSAAGEGIAGVNDQGKVIFINPAAEKILGWTAQELIGEVLHEYIHHTKSNGSKCVMESCDLCKIVKVGLANALKREDVFWRKDNTSFPAELVCTSILDNGEPKGAVMVFSDITSRKKVQEELEMHRKHLEKLVRERTDELVEANEQLRQDIIARKKAEEEAEHHRRQLIEADKMVSLGVLVAGVAHEINNPNNFISMNAPILQKFWEDSKPILDEYYKREGDFVVGGINYSEMREYIPELFSGIQDGSERIKKIVLNLRDYARQSISELDQLVDINEVLQAAMVLLANPLKKATYHLNVEYAENIPLVKGNFQRVEQVIINIIQNAYQALDDPSQAITISTSFDALNKQVVIQVRDEGCGISKSDMKYIQDPFFTTKRDSGGSGLGLSISAGIMEEHRGSLAFESEPGQGATVTIRFPVDKCALES